MTPERKEMIGGHKVEEYYWNRKMVVYVDNRFTEGTFRQVCERLKGKRK